MSHVPRQREMSTVPSMPMKRRVVVAAVGLLTLALAGCAQDAPQDTWQPAGDNAQKIHNLQWPIFAIAGVVGVIVFAVIGFAVFRFRDRGQDIPEQSHGNPALEIGLTILPAVLLLGIAIPTVSVVFDLAQTDDAECVINVTGQQWWWEYDYPSGDCGGVEITEPIVTSGELVIPTDTNVLLNVTSRDVIHSFWIPRLNGKKDAVPGRTHPLRMQADDPGLFDGQCTEFCGLSHARMRQAAVALDKNDFATWVNNQLAAYEAPTDDVALEGESTFISQCSRCHQVNGLTQDQGGTVVPVLAQPDQYVVSGAAPNLTHLMTRTTFAGATFDLLTQQCKDDLYDASSEEFGALYLQGVTEECLDEVNLRKWLRNAPDMKPMFADPDNLESTGGLYRGMPNLNLSDDQIDSLIAYLIERK
jgi:cytochrome c oxidase subunit II